MGKQKKRSPCPVACTLDVIGDKWTLLVVRDLVCGKSTFKEFASSPEGIATNILTDRLYRLVNHGLVEKYPAAHPPQRAKRRLTSKGRTLIPVLNSISEWGLEHIEGTAAWMRPKGG